MGCYMPDIVFVDDESGRRTRRGHTYPIARHTLKAFHHLLRGGADQEVDGHQLARTCVSHG